MPAYACDVGAGPLLHAQLAERLAGLPGAAPHLDLLDRQVAARRRDDVEERRHLRLDQQVRHHAAGDRVRRHDAVGARESDLFLGLLVGRARDDDDVRPLRLDRERDVEVRRVVVGRSDEPARVLEPGSP